MSKENQEYFGEPIRQPREPRQNQKLRPSPVPVPQL